MKVDAQRKVVRKLDQDKAVATRNKEIASAMKKEGEPIDKISKYTGLSTEEIEKQNNKFFPGLTRIPT